MRIPVIVSLLALGIVSAGAQGQIIFNNRVNGVLVAPIYGLDPVNSQLSQRGNTSTGFPAGTQSYGGASLAGTGYTAQLFAGTTNALSQNLQPLTPAVFFRMGDSAGFVIAPATTLTVPGVREGEPAKVILRAWENRGGTVTDWTAAAGRRDIAKGESWAFITLGLGGPFFAPPNLVGLESFNLSTGGVWQTGIKINFQPASAPVPTGYGSDTGATFNLRSGGLNYGWNLDHSLRAADRNSVYAPDQRHDTLIAMQTGSMWELAVSNGLYGVHICLGDPTGTNASYGLRAEGVALAGPATFRGRWLERDGLIRVADGRLTIQSTSNTPICFIEVARIDSPVLAATRSNSSPGILDLRFVGEVGLRYGIETSSDFQSWSPVGQATLGRGAHFLFLHTYRVDDLHLFYRAAVFPDP